jgi:hypothetical protein
LKTIRVALNFTDAVSRFDKGDLLELKVIGVKNSGSFLISG